jgi:AmmeMemoRadiSam system protein B
MKILAMLLALVPIAVSMAAEEMRPIRDDVGYCWNPESMRVLVDYLRAEENRKFPTEGLVAAITPHDDYLYAGRVYFPLYNILRTKEVVVFGVTHGTVRKEIGDPHEILILDEFPQWHGLNGPVPISSLRERIKEQLDKKYFTVNNKAQTLEHSIEGQIPFLQYFNPEIRITPIMVTGMPFAKMDEVSTALADIIAGYVKENHLVPGKDIFFLISSDGNHYGQDFDNSPFGEGEAAWKEARALDQRIISEDLTGNMDKNKVRVLTTELWGKTFLDYKNTYWCGKYSVPFGLLTTEKVLSLLTGKQMRGQLFRYSDTYSEGTLPLRKTGMGTTAPFSLRHWVSFCSIGYYLQ